MLKTLKIVPMNENNVVVIPFGIMKPIGINPINVRTIKV